MIPMATVDSTSASSARSGETGGAAWLVLPTYNEAENIEAMVTAVRAQLGEVAPGAYRVLVVDDSSPDGTGRIADRLAAEHPEVEVLHRAGKEGLGRAYIAGFGHALEQGAQWVLQMDSDFSHDPKYLRDLLTAARAGAGLVIGSRYIRGGGVKDWGPVRRLLSRGGCLYAQAILTVPVRDLTGGLKCWRRETLLAIDLPSVDSQGYSFQIETTFRAVRAGARVVEVPIVFVDREVGDSKMSSDIALEAIRMVPRLRLRARRAVRPVAEVAKDG